MLLYTTTPTAKKRGMNRDIYNEEKMCVLSHSLVFSSSFLSSFLQSLCQFFFLLCSSFVFFLVFFCSFFNSSSSSILQSSFLLRFVFVQIKNGIHYIVSQRAAVWRDHR